MTYLIIGSKERTNRIANEKAYLTNADRAKNVGRIEVDTKEDFDTPVSKNEYKGLLRSMQDSTANKDVQNIIQKEIHSLDSASNSGIKKN